MKGLVQLAVGGVLVGTLCLVAASDETSRLLPVPDAAGQKSAEAHIKGVFKEAFAAAQRDAEAKITLARRLFQSGTARGELPAHRYVCFRQAMDLSAQAGDLKLALAALTELGNSFEIDALKLKGDVFQTARSTPRDAAGWRVLGMEHLRTMSEAVGSDRYEIALAMVRSFKAVAESSKSLSLSSEAAAVKKDIAQIHEEFLRTRNQRALLEDGSRDPAATLAVGKFLCLMKNDWKKGLPLLERSSVAAFNSIGVKERSLPTSPEEQVSLGDGWWQVASAETGPLKIRMQRRAAGWYEKALDKLEGLSKVRIEKALEEYESALYAAGLSRTTYLSDLSEEESKVAHKFGKRGDLGYRALDVHAFNRVVVNGKESPNGISTHALPRGTAFVSYVIDGEYDHFEADVALVDGDGKPADSPLVFQVLGDDKVLWTSGPIQKPREVKKCKVRLRAVRRLRLEVSCPGDHNRAHSVWVEPRLIGEGFLSSMTPS